MYEVFVRIKQWVQGVKTKLAPVSDVFPAGVFLSFFSRCVLQLIDPCGFSTGVLPPPPSEYAHHSISAFSTTKSQLNVMTAFVGPGLHQWFTQPAKLL